MSITPLEKQWLNAYMNNDIVKDYGWQDKDACGWTASISEESNIALKSVSGVISSLVKKELLIVQNFTEDSECNLTDKGREVCSSFKS